MCGCLPRSLFRDGGNLNITGLHRISSFFILFFRSGYLPSPRHAAALRQRTPACLSCEDAAVHGSRVKPTAPSVNHGVKFSQDRLGGAVFADAPAGKLDVWSCMAESVQVNLWRKRKCNKCGDICSIFWLFFFLPPSLCALLLFSPHQSICLSGKISTTRTGSNLSHHLQLFFGSGHPPTHSRQLFNSSNGLQLLGNS